MVADGRYLAFMTAIHDRPGALAQLVTLLADAGANVLDVVHERTRSSLAVDDVEVLVVAETRGRSHREEILAVLADGGYAVHEAVEPITASQVPDVTGP